MDSYAKGENCVLFNYHFTQDASERYKAIELLIPSCNNQEVVVVELLNLHERTTFPSTSKSLGEKKNTYTKLFLTFFTTDCPFRHLGVPMLTQQTKFTFITLPSLLG